MPAGLLSFCHGKECWEISWMICLPAEPAANITSPPPASEFSVHGVKRHRREADALKTATHKEEPENRLDKIQSDGTRPPPCDST